MENDIAPLDVKRSRQYNDFGTQIKGKAWQRKLIGDGFSERKKITLGFSEVCCDLDKEGNRECRSFVIGLKKPASEVEMLNYPNTGYFFPRDSSLPCNELQASSVSKTVVELRHADESAVYEKNDDSMSAIGRISYIFNITKTHIPRPLFLSKSTRVRRVLINSSLGFSRASFCNCFTLCLLLSLQFSSAQKLDRGLTLAVEGSDQLTVGDEQHRTPTGSKLTSLAQANGQFDFEQESGMSYQQMLERDHNELQNGSVGNGEQTAIKHSDELNTNDRIKMHKSRRNTHSEGESVQNASSDFNSSLRHRLFPKNSEVKLRRLDNASFRSKPGVGDLVDIPFTSRERDSPVASFLSQRRKRSVLSNVSSPNGNVRHVASLAGDEHVFLTPVSGSLLDIPVVNLESAYKVRRLTWNHRQAGKSLSQSNFIFRKGFSKVLRGTLSADKNLIRYKRSHQSGGLSEDDLSASLTPLDVAQQHAEHEGGAKEYIHSNASGNLNEKATHGDENDQVNGNSLNEEDSENINDFGIFQHYGREVNASFGAAENLLSRRDGVDDNDSLRSDGGSQSSRIHQRSPLQSQDLRDSQVSAGAKAEVYESPKIQKSVRDKDKDRSLGSPKSSVLGASVNQSDGMAAFGAGTRSQAGSYASRTINTSSIGFSKHDQAERVQTSAKIPSDFVPTVAREEFQPENIKTKPSNSSLLLRTHGENSNSGPFPERQEKSRSLMTKGSDSNLHEAMKVVSENADYNNVLKKIHKTATALKLSEVNNPDTMNAVYVNSIFEIVNSEEESKLKPIPPLPKVKPLKNSSTQEQINNESSLPATVDEGKRNLTVYNAPHPHRHENSRGESPFDASFVREDIRRKEKTGNRTHEHKNSSDSNSEMKSRSTRSFKGKARAPDFRFAKNGRKQASTRDNDGLARHASSDGDGSTEGSAGACGLGYYACRDGSCVIADRFCNGEADCSKGEDEPAHCSPCDHIYYGEVGRTYEVQVQWPRRNLRDSTCNVTLVAAGGPHGDIVQVALRKFSLGKFNSHTDQGCPHGHMQIVENMRHYRPGYWCGDGVGLDIYYSETPSVTLLLTRLKMDNDLTAIDSFSGFYFKMAYKFLKQSDAIVRYGTPDKQKFTGVRSSSSMCHFMFPACDVKPCYVQSPNFPGLYPRNTTCYYHITQTQIPFGKKALISLKQRKSHLINVKSSKQPLDTEERHLKLYDDCYYVGDYVRIYDGNSTKSPVLLTFCRGAELPEITSSGASLLIEFTTSPYDSPNHESPWKYVSGFELVATTKFVSKISTGSTCYQILTPQKNYTGWIGAPMHSVTPNSTCVWDFRGPPGYIIWIIFARYARETQVRRHHTTLCEARLTIQDGSLGANETSLASHCRDTLPRTCDRIARLVHGNSTVPPCGPYESYVTHGEQASISQEYGEGSLVTKVRFLAKYEFIDARQAGEEWFSPCSRIIYSNGTDGARKLSAPKNVFLYGRGGRKSIHCSWLIQGKSEEVVRLTIHSVKTGGSACRTLVRPLTESLDCDGGEFPLMKLHLSEVPWKDVEVPRACLCSQEVLPHTIESRGSALLLNMTLSGMGPGDDHRTFNFDVEYEFVSKPECTGGNRRLSNPAGGVVLGSEDTTQECDSKPWLLEAPIGHSFLLTLPKATLANESCSTDSRLVLRTPGATDTLVVVCPAAAQDAVIQLVWPPIPGLQQQGNSRPAFLQNFVRGIPQLVAQWEPRRASALKMQWLHLRDPAKVSAETDSTQPAAGRKKCKELCAALGACIAQQLWCDGTSHCPDGSDETLSNCFLERIPWLYLAMVGLTLVVLILISASTIARQHRQKSEPLTQGDNIHNHHDALPPPPPIIHRNKKKLTKETRRASTQETILPAKDNHHRLSAYTPEEYTDMDFETTV